MYIEKLDLIYFYSHISFPDSLCTLNPQTDFSLTVYTCYISILWELNTCFLVILYPPLNNSQRQFKFPFSSSTVIHHYCALAKVNV